MRLDVVCRLRGLVGLNVRDVIRWCYSATAFRPHGPPGYRFTIASEVFARNTTANFAVLTQCSSPVCIVLQCLIRGTRTHETKSNA